MTSQPHTPSPQVIVDLAEACVRFVHQAVGIELDYAPETLSVLDHYLDSIPKQRADEVLGLVVPAAGVYFGEVLRRSYGAVHWHCPDEDYAAFRLEFEQHFLAFNPIGSVLEAVSHKDMPGWHAHFALLDEDRDAVHASLETTFHVHPQDYYRLSVRYEVIDQILGVLASGATLRGDTHRHFSHAVYRAAGIDDND